MDVVEDFALLTSFSPWRDYDPASSSRALIDSGLFRHFLSVNMEEDTFEVPAVLAKMAFDLKREGFKKLVVPLFTSDTCRDASMVNSILKYLGRADFTDRLRGVRASKGELYYGCPGLLLDKDFQPLFVTTVVINSEGEIISLNCRIPHCIFERQDELIPKAIYKKFIPLYGTTAATASPLARSTTGVTKKVEIKIGMGANIVFHSNVPRPSNATEEDFMRILRDNVDSFV